MKNFRLGEKAFGDYNFLMKYKNYFHETPSRQGSKFLEDYDHSNHKNSVWNAFLDSGLEGVNDDDFSIIPRLLPESYLPVIEKTCKDITTFMLKLLSLPEKEILAIVPAGPLRDFLVEEMQVLKFRSKRITGSFRFDMAVVGKPDAAHPPQLLEVNEIGFDGLARSSFFQSTLMNLIPGLDKKARALNTAAAEVRNMKRLGTDIARIQYDCYNWDEHYLKLIAEGMGSQLHLVSPNHYKTKIDADFPHLTKKDFTFSKGRVRVGKDFYPDALNMSFAFTLNDLKRDIKLYQDLVRSQTPQYGPFLTSLVASKTILILLSDVTLRRKLLGTSDKLNYSILTAFSLEGNAEKVRNHSPDYVIKHTDGFGGSQVFMDKEMLSWLSRIPKNRQYQWVVQQKTKLNTVDVNGLLSRQKKVISDLGVFIHYDWNGERFTHFEVGGLMSRGTNKGLKVNVSSGGLQIPVMLERGR